MGSDWSILIIKHVLLVPGVIAGAVMWVRIGKSVRQYREQGGQ